MKRIEAVITPWTLDAFRDAAPHLGISEFDLVQVYRSGGAATERQQRLYRGREFTTDLLPRLRVEFVLFDDDLKATLHGLRELVHPERIAIFTLDQEIRSVAVNSGRLHNTLTSGHIDSTGQIELPLHTHEAGAGNNGEHLISEQSASSRHGADYLPQWRTQPRT